MERVDVFILGAGKPTTGRSPAALKDISRKDRALDWQLHSFAQLPNPNFHFLGGYQVERIVSQYPMLNYTLIPDWQNKSVLHTLLRAPFRPVPTVITYADTVVRDDVIRKLVDRDADVGVVYDSRWKQRYEARSEDDISAAEVVCVGNGAYKGRRCKSNARGEEVEFTGAIWLSPKVSGFLSDADEESIGSSLPDLIDFLARQGYEIDVVDACGEWAEFNSPNDVARFVLGTKAETLARLAPHTTTCQIGEQVSFTICEWRQDPNAVLSRIVSIFPHTKLVVRSSNREEDGWLGSNAGGFESVLDIDSTSGAELFNAIEVVIASYGEGGGHEQNQVLVQEFVQGVICSGVVFTRSLENGSPYYRLNFDDTTFSTDSVTSGKSGDLRTIILSRDKTELLSDVEPKLLPVINAVKELEQLLNFDKLDIEFAVDRKGEVHIFQVRPIAVHHSEYDYPDQDVSKLLNHAVGGFRRLQAANPFVHGSKALFGNMPDWNPAEIIGTHPRPLALSLYQYLITNDVWAKQRAEYGYRDVRPQPLIVSFCGQPYVDIRASLNSFIPASISDSTAANLTEAYLSLLQENPHLHDKLEFSVAFTVWTPSYEMEARERLGAYGITDNEVKELGEGLRPVTKAALFRLESDTSPIGLLGQRRSLFQKSKLSDLDKAMALLDDCRSFGTLAFSHAARAGFVASSFLKSFARMEWMTELDCRAFMGQVSSVTSELEQDRALHAQGELEKELLISRYGHLRPGTYDAQAEAYWEMPERYLLANLDHVNDRKKKCDGAKTVFNLDSRARNKIDAWLETLGVEFDCDRLFRFMESAIASRESVKFEFTKNISSAIDHLVAFRHQLGVDREEISYLHVNDFKQIQLGSLNLEEARNLIEQRKLSFGLGQMVELPRLVFSEADFFCFERQVSQPNFVTGQRIEGRVICWSGTEYQHLAGAIVLIPQADPGYDWLFSHDIKGLITMYGGANSHMTIRAAELGLPAAIGVGEQLFEKLSRANVIMLDCNNKSIKVLT